MDSLFIRAVRRPLDYIRIFNHYPLTLLQRTVTGSVHTLSFTAASKLQWQAGQHGIFSLSKKNSVGMARKDRWRVFSIASAPSEAVITISTLISDTPSQYKRVLSGLQIGDTMTLAGPIGEFYVRPKMTELVGVAGGIGITPFRSLLLEMANQQITDLPVTLIYSSKRDQILYHDELELLKARLPLLAIIYCEGVEATTKAVFQQVNEKPTATYFLSGAPRMLQSLRALLTTNGVKHIISDPFKGY